MTPSRNVEIAIARAFHESNTRSGSYISPVPWDDIDIEQRVKMANAVNELILSGVILPGDKIMMMP